MLPPDDFMKQTNDADDAFTFRRVDREYLSTKLEQVVSATILGFAKERFRKRKFDEAPSQSATPIKREALSSGDEVLSGSEDEEESSGGDPSETRSPGARLAGPQTILQPAVATNDEISYELIQPSTRGILQNLDKALTILHNTRMTSAQTLLEAAASSSSEDEDQNLYDEATPSRRSRSRSRSRAYSQAGTERSRSRNVSGASGHDEVPKRVKKKSNRGRKPELLPLQGESERDFLIRRAKLQKKKVPVFSDDEKEEGTPDATAENTKEVLQRSRQKHSNRREGRNSAAAASAEYWQRKRLERLNQRDWSDVMGAAALAGFSPKVIARATQRCANLFGQGMEMHTIGDGIGSSSTNGMETKRYVPGESVPSSSSESDGDDDSIALRQARSMSRHSSMAPSRAPSVDSTEDEILGLQSPRKRQKRSRSRGAALANHYCPRMDCERAIVGFDRPYNLKRHIKLVHQGQEATKFKTDDANTEDVHIDGFLEPIRMQKGWRTEDTTVRARKSPPKRRRDESVSDGEGPTIK